MNWPIAERSATPPMAILPIIKHPHDVLRKKTEDIPVSRLKEKGFQQFLNDMIETMYAAEGIGLAANQVGKSWNVCTIATKDGAVILVNPRIIRRGIMKQSEEEGCLSVPGLWGPVKRSKTLQFQALDRDGNQFPLTRAKGLFARVIQHEVDHLSGLLFIDRAKRTFHHEN